jgi:hypothetical protein
MSGKVTLETHYVPGLRCPNCGSRNDGMTVASTDGDATPQSGSMGVCVYCFEFLAYVDGALRLATTADFDELDESAQRTLRMMQNYARAVAAVRGTQ